jgi:hypothetical protein
MKAKYSYFRLEYARSSGNKKVTRYCRVDQLGKVSYAEVRINRGKNPAPISVDMYKMGNTSFLMGPLHQTFPSTKAEFTKAVKEAIAHIL